jgi:hypothetical protein
MRKLVVVACFALAASPYAVAYAQDAGQKTAPAAEKSAKKEPSEKQKAHQARMKDCAAQADGRKGEERKQFMSACLKG